jgi:hypothetical protein
LLALFAFNVCKIRTVFDFGNCALCSSMYLKTNSSASVKRK